MVMDDIIKDLDLISRHEYIYYNWTNVTSYGDEVVMMVRGLPRTPAEAYQAAKEWDVWRPIASVMTRNDHPA